MTCTLLKSAVIAGSLMAGMASAQAQTLLSEGFENVAGLSTQGWFFFNASELPLGPGFGQGSASQFAAQAGSADSFAFSGFAINATDTGAAAAVLYTPELDLSTDVELTFWTRTVPGSNYADRLSVGVEYSDGSFGDLLTINPGLIKKGYPNRWTQHTVSLGGLGTGTTGYFYFAYDIPDVSVAGNYIGIDSVTVTALPAVPEPESWLLMGLGLAGLGLLARRRSC